MISRPPTSTDDRFTARVHPDDPQAANGCEEERPEDGLDAPGRMQGSWPSAAKRELRQLREKTALAALVKSGE